MKIERKERGVKTKRCANLDTAHNTPKPKCGSKPVKAPLYYHTSVVGENVMRNKTGMRNKTATGKRIRARGVIKIIGKDK